MQAQAQSTWAGTWRKGGGTISTRSGILDGAKHSFATRFDEPHGASPEELFAAAHAACFNQALANNLDHEGLTAASVETTVEVSYGIVDGRPTISGSHITVIATVPQASKEVFQAAAAKSSTGCAISRILTVPITITATLLEMASTQLEGDLR